jgi:hypothetical protein
MASSTSRPTPWVDWDIVGALAPDEACAMSITMLELESGVGFDWTATSSSSRVSMMERAREGIDDRRLPVGRDLAHRGAGRHIGES